MSEARLSPIRPAAFMVACAMLAGCHDDQAQAGPPPGKPEVDIVTLHTQSVPILTDLPGRTAPFRTAEVRPQVGGVILRRPFAEGEAVEAGQLLYEIDPAPYQASLATAQATLQKALATVKTSQATAARYKPLADANAISRLDLDNAVGTVQSNQADVASARASVRTAEINLARTRVTAPIAGRTGRSAFTEGALVTENQSALLVTVTELNPIYVDIVQPSATLLRLKREMAAGQLHGTGGNEAAVKLMLEDGVEYGPVGRLQFSEVTVDQATGSVTLRAIFPNPAGLLLPGMFVRGQIQEGTREHAILAPQQGVTRNPRGEATALVVGVDNKVSLRTLTAERAIGADWLVTAGLQDGDRIVVKGLQKVRPGAEVTATEAQPHATQAAR